MDIVGMDTIKLQKNLQTPSSRIEKGEEPEPITIANRD